MNDEQLEQHLRNLPAPELPAAWRGEILARALRESRVTPRASRFALLPFLRKVIARNPYTAGALIALWMLIFLFKATTPVDRSEQEMLAHFDPTKPVYLVDLAAEIRLAELLENPPEERPARIP